MEQEVWKPIKGFEEIYSISNLGRVKRISNFKLCNKKYIDNYFLKPLDNGRGYYRIKLSKNGVSKRFMLHRLLADAFLQNPNNYKIINHKDHNKKNNELYNLEWCTQKYNVDVFNKLNPLKGCKARKTKGYVYSKRDNVYICITSIDCIQINLGSYKTKEESVFIYNYAHDLKIKFLSNRDKSVEDFIKEIREKVKKLRKDLRD